MLDVYKLAAYRMVHAFSFDVANLSDSMSALRDDVLTWLGDATAGDTYEAQLRLAAFEAATYSSRGAITAAIAGKLRRLAGNKEVDSMYTYEEQLRLALYKTIELLEHSIAVNDTLGDVAKFTQDLRTLVAKGPPIIGSLTAVAKAHSGTHA